MTESTYAAGTISVSVGATAVSGALTAFAANVKAGDLLKVGGSAAIIAGVGSNTALTLAEPWPGPALAARADYLILRTGAEWRETVTLNAALVAIIRRLEAGQGLRPDVVITATADLADHDDLPAGSIVADVSTDPFTVWIKASATSGDWAGPQPMFPSGADGATVAQVLAGLGLSSVTISTSPPSGPAAAGALWFQVAP